MNESAISGAAADRAAIERWEDEGGSTLALDDAMSFLPNELLPSKDLEDRVNH